MMQALKQLIETIQSHAQPIIDDPVWWRIGNGVQLANPATEEEIEAFELEATYPLTKSLRELYLFSNGITFTVQGRHFHIMSLAEARKYLGFLNQYELPQLKHAFPLFDNNDSNPWLVCCVEPLEDYLIYLPHDGEMGLKYRSIESLFAAMNWHFRPWLDWKPFDSEDEASPEAKHDLIDNFLDMEDIPYDMTQKVRKAGEIEAAKKLLAIAEPLSQWDRVNGFKLAFDLFSENEAETIEAFLYDSDGYVATDAYTRLKMFSPPMPMTSKILKNLEAEFAKFIDDCAEALRQADINVTYTECKDFTGTIKVESIHLNMPMFFAARKEHRDIFAQVVERTKKLIQLKL
jgi:hypothetical protein